MSRPSPASPRRRLGARGERVRQAVLAAAQDLWLAERAPPSVEQVAQRAGVQKTTIYRRWGSLENLLFEVVRSQVNRSIALPDTGDVLSDLRVYLQDSVIFLQSEPGRMLALLSGHAPEASRQAYWQARFLEVSVLFERAYGRGELLRPVDGPLLIEMLIAPLYMRLLVSGAALEDGLVERMLAVIQPYLRTP